MHKALDGRYPQADKKGQRHRHYSLQSLATGPAHMGKEQTTAKNKLRILSVVPAIWRQV